jgi:hypothetical protein
MIFSGKVLDAGIFPGLPDTYDSKFPEFYARASNDPFAAKIKFIWDFGHNGWVWDDGRSSSKPHGAQHPTKSAKSEYLNCPST